MKHGYPNVNKAPPRVNAASQEDSDAGSSSSSGSSTSTSSNISFSQDQLTHLVSLLQQANLVVPASPTSQETSNHIDATPLISTNISAAESS